MPDDLFQLVCLESVTVIELALPDELDSSEFDRLNDSILPQIIAGPTRGWILDMSQVDYVGSAVLGLMVNMRQRVKKAQGQLVLCGMSPRLLQIFRTSSLESLFVIAKDRPAALKLAAR